MMFLSGRRAAKAMLAACALALAACGPAPAVLDTKSPTSVAESYVRAFNAKDLKAMIPLVDGANRVTIEAALKGGPESEDYKDISHPDVVSYIAAQEGKVEGPRYEPGVALFKIAQTPREDIFLVELANADDGSWIIKQFRVSTNDWFNAMSREPVAALPEAPPPAAVEPVRPLRSITAEAIRALAAPFPEAAMGAGNGDPEEAIPESARQQAAALDRGMLRRAMDYPSYIIQLEFCGQDGAWLLADFTNRLTERGITGEGQALFLKILSSARSWHEAAFRARDAEYPDTLAMGTCPGATKEDFMRFVDTDWEGKAD